MAVTLIFAPPARFINANDRLHFKALADRTRAWRNLSALAVHQTTFTPLDQAHITVSIRFENNRRRDVGNLYPTAKAIVDGLVDAGVLPDDNDTHVIGPDMRREYPNGPARVTVTITPLEQP